MSDVTTIHPGHMLWTKGSNEFGDQRQGGMFVGFGHDPEVGEQTVTLLTFSPATPRQASLHLQDRKGFHNLGLVSRLMRVPTSTIDMAATNDCPGWAKVADHARRALIAASLPPNDHLGSRGHTDLIAAYRVLRDEALRLHGGEA